MEIPMSLYRSIIELPIGQELNVREFRFKYKVFRLLNDLWILEIDSIRTLQFNSIELGKMAKVKIDFFDLEPLGTNFEQ